jgi:hypothetical protein
MTEQYQGDIHRDVVILDVSRSPSSTSVTEVESQLSDIVQTETDSGWEQFSPETMQLHEEFERKKREIIEVPLEIRIQMNRDNVRFQTG